jgi:hypothetical protein
MHFQVVGDRPRRVALQTHHNPLNAENYTRFSVFLGLSPQSQELRNRSRVAFGKDGLHISNSTRFAPDVELFMRAYIAVPKASCSLLFAGAPIVDVFMFLVTTSFHQRLRACRFQRARIIVHPRCGTHPIPIWEMNDGTKGLDLRKLKMTAIQEEDLPHAGELPGRQES